MMMRSHVRFEAQRAVMERDFFENAGIEESLDVLVNGAQGNGWNPPPDLLVDQFRGGVLTRIDNGFVDHLTLECEGKTLFLATLAEVVEGSRTQIRH